MTPAARRAEVAIRVPRGCHVPGKRMTPRNRSGSARYDATPLSRSPTTFPRPRIQYTSGGVSFVTPGETRPRYHD